jgi:hypothetical protein
MRILGCVVALLVLSACSASSGDGAGGDTSDPASQARLGKEALEAARPGITAALAPTDHSFGGSHMSCRLGRNSFEYTINGGVIAGADTWAAGVDAVSDELARSGWTLGTSANEVGVQAERDGVSLYVQRQRRSEDGVEWRVQITTPCVSYSEEDADTVRGGSGTDDLTGDF